MGAWRVMRGRIERWAAHYDGPLFHALLCDPPYELGFMGRDWDRSGVSFWSETWAALAEHLHPGAFGMAFASSRGWHRLACAIEDAGLVIHPSIFGWAFGSGFPKATRVDTQVDAAAGYEIPHGVLNSNNVSMSGGNYSRDNKHVPITPLAQVWEGHRYGLQALKPALEPIVVFQKPYDGKPVEDITATGAGALWIDGGRVATQGDKTNARGNKDGTPESPKSGYEGGWGNPGRGWDGQSGRWPANLALVHHPECRRVGARRVRGSSTSTSTSRQIYNGGWGSIKSVEYRDADGLETIDDWECHADCPVRALGEQSGQVRASCHTSPSERIGRGTPAGFMLGRNGSYTIPGINTYNDNGTAARFFFQAEWALERAEPVFYCAKASRAERDAGLGDMPQAVGHNIGTNACARCGRRVKHNGSGVGCECGAQRETVKLPTGRNPHPTVKPLALCKWLATLLLPPQEYAPRRLLVPFAGSGSEMIGALLAGWDWILGIELLAENARLAEARLAWWADKARWGQTEPAALLSEYEPDNGHEQLELWG